MLSQQALTKVVLDERAIAWTRDIVDQVVTAGSALASAMHLTATQPVAGMFLWIAKECGEQLEAVGIDVDHGLALGDALSFRLCVAREREVILDAAKRIAAARG